MKYKTFLLGGLVCILTFSQCLHSIDFIYGSSNTIGNQYLESDFNRISISNTCDAVITYADSFSITVTVNENIRQHVNVVKENDHLRIFLDHGYNYRKITFRTHITLPVLKGISASGASKAQLNGFNSGFYFEADLSGASSMSGTVISGDANFTLSGASEIMISGEANNIECKVSGASKCKFDNYICNNVYVNCSGASNVTVNANGTISGRLSGASTLYYYGNPTLGSFYTSGSSTVKKKG